MKFFLLFKITFILQIGCLSAQHFIAATPKSICAGSNEKVTFKVYTSLTGDRKFLLYKKDLNNEGVLVGENTTGNFPDMVHNHSGAGEITYYAEVIKGKDTLKTSNEEKIIVKGIPEALKFKTVCNSEIVLTSDQDVINLLDYIDNIPSNHTLTITGKGVWGNKLYPSTFTGIETLAPKYTLVDKETKCLIQDKDFSCSFKVHPAIDTEVSFIDKSNPPPYCENSGMQNVKIVLQNSGRLMYVRVNNSLVFANDTYSNIKTKTIVIDPREHNNYQIKVEIEYSVPGSIENIKEEADIYIIPDFSPKFSGLGLRMASTENDINVCASILRQEGKFSILKTNASDKYTFSFSKITADGEVMELPFEEDQNNNESSKTKINISDQDTFVEGEIPFEQIGIKETDILVVTVEQNNTGKCPGNKVRNFNIRFKHSDKTTPKLVLPPQPYCANDELIFKINSTTNTNAVDFYFPWIGFYFENYELNMGEGEGIYSTRTNQISHVYNRAGEYALHFKATNPAVAWNCPIDTIIRIEVGAIPSSNFEVKENIEGRTTVFENLSEIKSPSLNENFASTDKLAAYSWDFGDQNSNSEFLNEVKHSYAYELRNEPYEVTLMVSTSKGCSDRITKYIPVFALEEPTPEHAYENTFEGEFAKEFYHSGQYKHFPPLITQNSSWDVKEVSSKYGQSWQTFSKDDAQKHTEEGTSYNRKETSWVESPAFILDNLERPMVRMNTWVSAESQVDGVNFQYCIMDTSFGNETWKTLGEIRKGLNWYNSSIIVTKSLGEAKFDQGWTGTGATDWQLSAYALDNVKEEAKELPVRFRFSFTSNNENPPGKYNGFAFDNFFIGERNRVVLLENFQNTSTYNKEEIQEWQSDNQTAIISYYVGHLQKDSINEQNKADPSARALHYGVHKLPRLAIDGVSPQSVGMAWASDSIQKRKLTTSEFDITSLGLQVDADTRELVFKGKLYRNVSTELARPVLIQVAVVEDEVNVNGNTYTNVLRKLLPNAAGKRIASWPEEHFEEIEYRWQPFVAPYSGYKVVVFIQDEQSKEIYQAGAWALSEADAQLLDVKTTKQVSTSFRMPVYDEIILYPNPTNTEEVQVLFNGILEDDCIWELKDRLGIVHARGTVSKGVNLASLKLPNVASGIYQVNFIGKEYRQSAKLSIIK